MRDQGARTISKASAVALTWLLGCPADEPGLGGGPVPTTGGTSTSAASADTSVVDSTAGTSSSGSNTDEAGPIFLAESDVPGFEFECDFFAQDCSPGSKCMLWAEDGLSPWSATKCMPVVDEPDGAGEPCTVEGHPKSGLDTCDYGMMCWDLDPNTLEGICFAFCVGDESSPQCEDPTAQCSLCESCLPLCIPWCDPLAQDCLEGQACYPDMAEWHCGIDASGAMGAYGDPCERIDACDPGLICLPAATVPPGQPCEGATGCCTEVCDLSDPAGDLQCAGAAGGQQCLPWYDPLAVPPGYENVGVCALPP